MKELYATYSYTQYSIETLESLPLSEKTKQFLHIIGLPEIEMWDTFCFSPTLEDAIESRCNYQFYLQIGKLWSEAIFIAEDSDCLYTLSYDKRYLVNTNIQSFVIFLQIYAGWIIQNYDKAENEIAFKDESRRLMAQYEAIDKTAVDLSDNFWPLILQDLEEYLRGY